MQPNPYNPLTRETSPFIEDIDKLTVDAQNFALQFPAKESLSDNLTVEQRSRLGAVAQTHEDIEMSVQAAADVQANLDILNVIRDTNVIGVNLKLAREDLKLAREDARKSDYTKAA